MFGKGKSKAKKAESGKSSGGAASFLGHAFMRLVIAGLVVAAGWAGLVIARNRAVKLPDYFVAPSTVRITSKPDWVKGAIEEQLKRLPNAPARVSLLDRKATSEIASALASNPWVKEVRSVVRDFPDRVHAKVELREPTAYVLRNNRYYLVDAAGTRLPGEYKSRAEAGMDLLLIVYVRSTPPAAGKVWNDPAVVEGAKMAAFLRKYDEIVKAARISAIDTSNIGGRRTPRESEITLITLDQTRIYWGKGLDTPLSRELSPGSKIANLKAVLDQEGNLIAKEYVDIRFPDPVFRDRNYAFGGV